MILPKNFDFAEKYWNLEKGETDGLEREFNQQNEPGWYVVPRFSEEKLLSRQYEKEVLYRVEKNVEIPPVLQEG